MIGSNVIGSVPIGSCAAGVLVVPELCRVLINSVDVSDFVFVGADGSQAFTISEILTGATTGTLQLVEEDASTGPALDIEVGHEVVIEINGLRIFGGEVEDLKRLNPGQSSVVFWNLALKDFSSCMERRLVAASFEDLGDPVTQTAGSILTTIFNNLLDDGCLTLGIIEDGPLVQKANFNYITALNAFNEIQTLTGNSFYWKVDQFGVLSFRERTAVPAPYEINELQVEILSLDFDSSRETYRNRQFVRGGKDTTEPRLEVFEGDGKLKSFTMSLPVASKPAIEVNTVAVDPAAVGFKGIDEDNPAILWLFGVDDHVIVAATPPLLGDDIEITFQGLFNVIVQADNESEQTDRASIEKSNNGIYESLDVDESLNLSGTRQKAGGLLDKYSKIPKMISYQTDRDEAIETGQLQTVNLTRLDVSSAEMLIEQVDFVLIGSILRRTVRATDGREWLEWLEFFRNIVREPFILRDNESILIPNNIDEDLAFTDSTVVVLIDATIPFTDDPYTWMIVGDDFSIAKKIADPAELVFADSKQVDGPDIGDPVNI